MKIKIGVLGGIGPESTGEFYNKLIKIMQEKNLIKSNSDYPQIIVNSIPAPELVSQISDKELKPYIDGLKELDSLKPDFIVMICNTIHLYHELLQSKIATDLINLRDLVKTYLEENKIKSYLILGTGNTIEKGLYDFKDFKCFTPNNDEIIKINDAIFNFNKGFDKTSQKRLLLNISKKYLELGAETAILGCTEIALMLYEEEIPRVNTLDILVDSVIKEIERRKNDVGQYL